MMPDNTLRLTRSGGRIIGLTVIFLLLMIVLLEALLHVGFVQSYLSRFPINYGTRHHQMEIQLTRLEKFAAANGRVDCIMMGSSLVWLAFNPEVFEETYLNQTGETISCFNLGIETMTASGAAAIAQIVVEKYNPELFVYGTSARDYAPDKDAEDVQVILNSSWVRYESGNPSPLLWLENHSYIFRYAKQLQLLVRFDTDGLREQQEEIGFSVEEMNGFLPKTRPAQEVHFEAAARDAARYFHPYTIQQDNLDGLSQILNLQDADTRLIVVEMPVSDAYYDYYENGEADYDRFVEMLVSRTAEHNIPLMRTSDIDLIPEEGYWDRSHVNLVGANIFSQWLAGQIAELSGTDQPD